MLGEGKELDEVVRHLEVTEPTTGGATCPDGMNSDDAKRLRELERANARLKRIVADEELGIRRPAGDQPGNW